ncbi:MAG: cryptochrome/photolyase family protein [Actinomycetota bacterium]
MTCAIMWFRRDLRLADTPALLAALAEHTEVVPVFVVDPLLMDRSGAPRRAFMCDALNSLDDSMGRALVYRYGDPAEVIPALVAEVGASAVYAARDFAPYGIRRDGAVSERLAAVGVPLRFVGSPYAVNPGSILKDDGTSYSVFTPFSKRWLAHGWDRPLDAPRDPNWVGAPTVPCQGRPPRPDVTFEMPPFDEPGVHAQWAEFRDRGVDGLDGYSERRNDPGVPGTSRMSIALRWGVVHPRQLLQDLRGGKSHDSYRSEIAWREFYGDVLFRFPDSGWRNLNRKMDAMVHDEGPVAATRVSAWWGGGTGDPLGDAGLRELATTGWMHNRVRMIVASFLVKDLHLPWQWGARHFMAHLIDGDLASNAHGWQWTAGTGTDSAPYYRVFNPALQGERYDPNGDYVRKFVPEVADLPTSIIHSPGGKGGAVPLGYVAPIVDHAVERDEALARLKALG